MKRFSLLKISLLQSSHCSICSMAEERERKKKIELVVESEVKKITGYPRFGGIAWPSK